MRSPVALVLLALLAIGLAAFLFLADGGPAQGRGAQEADLRAPLVVEEAGAEPALLSETAKTIPQAPDGVSAIEEVEPQRASLEPTAGAKLDWIIEGRATFGYEDPAAGMRVLVQVSEGMQEGGSALQERELICDKEGRFRWPLAAPAGAVTVITKAAPDSLGKPKRFQSYGDSANIPGGEAAPKDLKVRFFAQDCAVFGVVSDAQGDPIEGAKVRQGNEVQVTLVDGAFRFAASSQGRQILLYTQAEGFAQKRSFAKTLGVTADVRVDIQLGPAAQVRGRVLDEAGLPIEGAEVGSFFTNENTAVSAQNGAFLLDHLDPLRDHHTVYARKAGYVEHSQNPSSDELAEKELEFVLKRGVRLDGLVLDPSGKPLEGATLYIGFSQFAYNRLDAVSLKNGNFSFPCVGAGSQSLTASYLGFAPVTQILIIEKQASTIPQIVLQLGAGHFLAGRVIDAEGQPLEGIWISGQVLGEYTDASATTDVEGRFRIEGLPEEDVGLELYGSEVVRLEQPMPELDRDDLEIIMQRAGRFGGRVVDAVSGEPLQEFSVRFVQPILRDGEERAWGYSATWGREGKRFSGTDGYWDSGDEEMVPGGIIGVEIRAEDYAPTTDLHVRVQADYERSKLVFSMQRGASVSGFVQDADGAPVEGCTLTLRPEGSAYRTYYETQYEQGIVQTDARGYFHLANAAPTLSILWVMAPGRMAFQDGPFELQSGQSEERLIRIPRGGRIEGVVLGESGEPQEGIKIILHASSIPGGQGFSPEARTDMSGAFSFEGLSPGRYQISRVLERDGESVYDQTISCELEQEGIQQVVLKPDGSCRIAGEIEFNGLPLTDDVKVQVRHLSDLEGNSVPSQGDKPVRTTLSTGGRFEIGGLAPGKYTVIVFHHTQAGFLNGTTEAETAEGRPAEVLITVKRQQR